MMQTKKGEELVPLKSEPIDLIRSMDNYLTIFKVKMDKEKEMKIQNGLVKLGSHYQFN